MLAKDCWERRGALTLALQFYSAGTVLGTPSMWSGIEPTIASMANAEFWHRWRSPKNRSRGFNNHKLGASHQTRVDQQMRYPSFDDSVAEIILSGQIDALEEY
jgi:hypothetical protein